MANKATVSGPTPPKSAEQRGSISAPSTPSTVLPPPPYREDDAGLRRALPERWTSWSLRATACKYGMLLWCAIMIAEIVLCTLANGHHNTEDEAMIPFDTQKTCVTIIIASSWELALALVMAVWWRSSRFAPWFLGLFTVMCLEAFVTGLYLLRQALDNRRLGHCRNNDACQNRLTLAISAGAVLILVLGCLFMSLPELIHRTKHRPRSRDRQRVRNNTTHAYP